jgi:selenocysteine-specific elongation factor
MPDMRKNLETILNVVIGTAGHIDHGKTTLVERLTGINPDRLPEEKERGMTIDLGFSRFEIPGGLRVGIVDVPGHERFVKNMVAGATGIDLVLLVVAADDGVMPQTREHLEIMGLLDLRHGAIALTKIDLVGPDLRDLVIEDLLETMRGTFLEAAPIVPVSSVTGEGIDRLRQVLIEEIGKVRPRDSSGPFRMPIQRIFSSKGFGTVLTGIPVSGSVAAGDTLEVVPLGKTGRVRGIHAYGEPTDLARAGHSSAVNITDIDYKEVHRGMVLAQPGYFGATRMVEARFRYLERTVRPLENLATIRFHSGTAETIGRIHLLEGKRMDPGSSAYVQFRLEDPVVVAPGDRYVVRLHSPMETIGGGEILDRSRWRLKAGKAFVIEALRRKEEAIGSKDLFIRNLIAESGFEAVPEKDLGPRAGLAPEEARKAIESLIALGTVLRSSRSGHLLSRERLEEARARARSEAERFFRENPRRLHMEKLQLRESLKAGEVFFADLIGTLEADASVRTVRGDSLEWAFHRPALDPRAAQAREKILAAFREAPLSPPRLDDAARAAGIDAALARSVGNLLLEEGELVKVAEDLLFHREGIEEARRKLREHLEKEKSMTASTAKTILESSRKYVIPLLEHFDREGFTLRRGDLRELRPR